MTGRDHPVPDFDMTYLGVPPWDIGRPQPEYVALSAAGRIVGDVLDVGCGTGEHALFLAEAGHTVLGIDSAPRAIAKARAKAAERGISAEFLVADALELPALGRQFDTVIDSGLFHVFGDGDRVRFAGSLAAVLRPGGRYFMLVFSDRQPGTDGPRRVSQGEIETTFTAGWQVTSINPARFETLLPFGEVAGWLAEIRRL